MSKIPLYQFTKEEVMTPERFIALVNQDRRVIEKSQFIPPKLGGKGFGMVRVTYRNARLKRVNI